MKSLFPLMLVAVLLLSMPDSLGQVVQLPTVGSFNISTSAAVPDSGSVGLGGNTYGRMGASSRGPMPGRSVAGSTFGGVASSVQATIIDLEELDSLIRSQVGRNPSQPKLHSTPPQEMVHIAAAPKGRIASPEYDYLAALSGHGQVLEQADPDAAAYYLGLAERAKNRRNWASVELYYRLAWNHLPAARREMALRELAKARANENAAPSPTSKPNNRR
jgi:hypothetical protein